MKKYLYPLNIFLLTIFLFTAFTSQQKTNTAGSSSTGILLETNFDGTINYGSTNQLIAAIDEGKSIRMGWELDFDGDNRGDLVHWVDAEFLSILNGHVFNQIAPIYQQIPKAAISQVKILNTGTQWTALIGTNGKMLSRYIYPDSFLDQIEDEAFLEKLAKRMEVQERMVKTMWAVVD